MKSCIPSTPSINPPSSPIVKRLQEALKLEEAKRREAAKRSLATFQGLQAFRKRLKRQKSLSPSK
jgi:hypothetical protein